MDKISKVATPIGAPNRPSEEPKRNIGIDLFIEDENSCRGPLGMEVDADSTVGELKRKVEEEFGIGSRNQARKGTHATPGLIFKLHSKLCRAGSTANDC